MSPFLFPTSCCRQAILPIANPVWKRSSATCMCEGSCGCRRLSVCVLCSSPPLRSQALGWNPGPGSCWRRALPLFYAIFSTPKARARLEQSRWGSLRVCSLSFCLSVQGFQEAESAWPRETPQCDVRPRCLAGCKDL